MGNQVFYNGVDIVSGLGVVSAIGKQLTPVNFTERWALKHEIAIVGQLTGICASGMSGVVDRVNNFVVKFAQDFQTLQIYQDNTILESFPYVKVSNIVFPANRYLKNLPFQVNLEVYPSGYFSGTFGVLDPKEEISFQEGDNGIVSVTHITSARGLQTSDTVRNSLNNAKSWVQARSGWQGAVLPAFATGLYFSPCLQTVAESLDRFNNTYEVKETYSNDIYQSGAGILRYVTEYNSGIENGISSMALRGTLNGCKDAPISVLRSRYAGFNAFNEALNQYKKITNLTDLNSIPLSKGVSEETTIQNISFSYLWDNNKLALTYFEYKIAFSFDFETDIITAAIDGVIRSREPIEIRFSRVLALANQIDLYSIIIPFYYEYVNLVAPYLNIFPLNPAYSSKRKTINEFEAVISLGATFDNSNILPAGLRSFDYSVNVSPAIRKYNAEPILNGQGQYVVFDLGYSRRSVCSVDIRGVGDDTATQQSVEDTLKHQAFKIQKAFLGGSRKHLQSQNINRSNANFSKNVTIQGVWSAEESNFNF